jgi:hypothetical protein
MNHITEVKRMMDDGLTVIANPDYLKSKLADKSSNEIKEMRQNDGQLTRTAQHEMSLRGNRLALIEFHRFMFDLSDVEVKRLWNAKKQFWFDNKLGEDKNSYCDVNLLEDATQYQLCIRDEKQFAQMIADEIARSFRQNMKLASNFYEITSDHMIHLAKSLLKDYMKNASNFQ